MRYHGRKAFWTIWCLGWYRIVSFNNKTIEFKLFIGPFVWTWTS